jgi:NTE family protein
MAGTAPEHRVARLHELRGQHLQAAAPAGTLASTHFDEMPLPWQIGLGSVAAMRALFEGQAGFFLPRVPPPPFAPWRRGSGAGNWYDTEPLPGALKRLGWSTSTDATGSEARALPRFWISRRDAPAGRPRTG